VYKYKILKVSEPLDGVVVVHTDLDEDRGFNVPLADCNNKNQFKSKLAEVINAYLYDKEQEETQKSKAKDFKKLENTEFDL